MKLTLRETGCFLKFMPGFLMTSEMRTTAEAISLSLCFVSRILMLRSSASGLTTRKTNPCSNTGSVVKYCGNVCCSSCSDN